LERAVVHQPKLGAGGGADIFNVAVELLIKVAACVDLGINGLVVVVRDRTRGNTCDVKHEEIVLIFR
jgi:hypothetical protein